ncbi:MAG: hypothetical protein ACRDIE_21250 [Chloroflexota bacterium]
MPTHIGAADARLLERVKRSTPFGCRQPYPDGFAAPRLSRTERRRG